MHLHLYRNQNVDISPSASGLLFQCYLIFYFSNCSVSGHIQVFLKTQPVKVDLNKKLDSKENTIQAFNIDAQGFKKQEIDLSKKLDFKQETIQTFNINA